MKRSILPHDFYTLQKMPLFFKLRFQFDSKLYNFKKTLLSNQKLKITHLSNKTKFFLPMFLSSFFLFYGMKRFL